MKQTKEKDLQKKYDIVNIDKILQFTSSQDVEEFKRIATGRKFCRVGERICDIYDEEIERYNYENCKNIFVKFFKRKKFKQEKLMLENRTTSIIRTITAQFIRNVKENEINKEEIISDVKKYILEKVNEYNRELSKAG